ncbi:hypothetical protein [Ruminiclostridium josui]|uniref:hypothetical protein n=1 Tax=Ruminiclostridium josui TaxID=1499 RepID=UPI0004631434|nr:hypothetical protein [Ruminiclostridium josui]
MFDKGNVTENFESFVVSCIDNRIDELSMYFNNSTVYSEFYDLYSKILKELRETLPPESFALIKQFDNLLEKLSVDYQNFFYRQGFQDCRILFTLLNK